VIASRGRLCRFRVEPRCDYTQTSGIVVGSVLLPIGATDREVEWALAAVGVYAPRGLDELRWSYATEPPTACIYDCSGNLMVRLRGVSANETNNRRSST
jgi:hypothetical protein